MTCPNCYASASAGTYKNYHLCGNCGAYFLPDVNEFEIEAYYRSGAYRKKKNPHSELEHQKRRAENITQYIRPPRVFVDVGSSAGVLLEAVKFKFGAACYGVDIDPVFAKDVYADIDEVPAAPDCVTLIHCLEHLPHPLDYLRRVYSKMADGGQIVIEVPNGDAASKDFYSSAFSFPHVVMFSPAALGWTLTAAGFSVDKTVLHGRGGVTRALPYYYLLASGCKAMDSQPE